MSFKPSINALPMKAVTTGEDGPRLLSGEHGLLTNGTIVLVRHFRAIDVGVFGELLLGDLLLLSIGQDSRKERIGDNDPTGSRSCHHVEKFIGEGALRGCTKSDE
jgi:hypothetical protein